MASINYRLKKGKSEWSSIYLRFKQGNQFDTEVSTGLECPVNRWSVSKQEVLSTFELNYKEVNKKLDDLKNYIKSEYASTKTDDLTVIINNQWLKLKVDLFFNRQDISIEEKQKIFFADFMDNFIEQSKTKRRRSGDPIKPRTIQHYNTTLNKIISFEKYYNTKLKIIEIDLNFHTKFIDYLEEREKLNNNTIGGYIDVIKMICNNAKNKGLRISHDINTNEFYTPKNKTKDIYLKEEEVNMIFEHKFDADYLDNARDWFVIGLRTGLRISDFLQLKKENIEDGFIFKTTLKTDFPVIIPIHDQVKSILEKRSGEFPREISDQKFNEYIKIVAEKSGLIEKVEGARIDEVEIIENGKKQIIHRKKQGKYPKFELISSHICRRSFATNLYGKLDTLTIMKITGHSTEKQFLSYIKITPREYAEKLKALWEKQKDDV
ncbi:site-specific integrase [Flavobacterium sp. 2]|uniref:site-specific integrase n=1 Tax=Flavobacterium sp. 2 TaxID=308053 RepID=UPI000C17E85D|nr:site-specific integrase [Flavobacterium sp. 2]PIF69465.1 site-specific recombinase XerD [Flavobacterium sp. 2]